MRRKGMLTFARLSAALLVWLVCRLSPASAQTPGGSEREVPAQCCDESPKAKCCPGSASPKCCAEGAQKQAAKQRPCGVPPDSTVAKAVETLEALGYSKEDILALPPSVILASKGSGNPVAFADLKCCETVVDLGCGDGIDCFLAAKRVGCKGKVIGVDKSPEAIAAAKENQCKIGAGNVEFRQGLLEKMPLNDHSVDVAISNCVGPVMRGDEAVLREAFRVLKPGGRLVTTSWGSLAGPELDPKLRAAGFEVIHRSKGMVTATKPPRHALE